MSEDSVPNSNEQKKREAGPAASFLRHALLELEIIGTSFTPEDLEGFAEDLRKRLGLLIGNEEDIREAFYIESQFSYHAQMDDSENMRKLREKITRSLLDPSSLDDMIPF